VSRDDDKAAVCVKGFDGEPIVMRAAEFRSEEAGRFGEDGGNGCWVLGEVEDEEEMDDEATTGCGGGGGGGGGGLEPLPLDNDDRGGETTATPVVVVDEAEVDGGAGEVDATHAGP